MYLEKALKNFLDDSFYFPTITTRSISTNDLSENIYFDEDKYVLLLSLPGFKKEDVSIEVSDGYLTLSGKKNLGDFEKMNVYSEGFSLNSSFNRKIKLWGNINPEQVDATMENGILKVELKKVKEKKLLGKQIEIK